LGWRVWRSHCQKKQLRDRPGSARQEMCALEAQAQKPQPILMKRSLFCINLMQDFDQDNHRLMPLCITSGHLRVIPWKTRVWRSDGASWGSLKRSAHL
jgi:hypothetical protein